MPDARARAIRAPVLRSSRSLVASRGARGRKAGGGVFSRRRLGPRPERNLIGYLCQGAYQRLLLNGSPEWRRAGAASRLLPHESAEFFGKKPPRGTSPSSSPRRKSRRDETSLFLPSARSSRRNLRLRPPLLAYTCSLAPISVHTCSHTQGVPEVLSPPGEGFPDIFNNGRMSFFYRKILSREHLITRLY